MLVFSFFTLAAVHAVSISKLLLEQHYPDFKIEPDLDRNSLMTSFISPEIRNMFNAKRNTTANFLNMIDPRTTSTVFTAQSVNLIHSMIVLDLKKVTFERARRLIDEIVADPISQAKQNPLLAILDAYDDKNESLCFEKVAVLLEFLKNECPESFAQRVTSVIPLLMELETDHIRQMLLILLIESFSRERLVDNKIVIETALGKQSSKDHVIEHILIDQMMALVGQPDEINIDEQIVKLGPLLQLAKMPCEPDNHFCK